MQGPISIQTHRPPPMSNAERQRQFRERNPGYYGRLHRRRTAAIMASLAEKAAAKVAVKTPLMLPAPVELIVIPGINAIPSKLTPTPEPLTVSTERSSC